MTLARILAGAVALSFAGVVAAQTAAPKAETKPAPKPAAKAADKPVVGRDWTKIDTNKDGYISPEEMEVWLKANSGPDK